MNGDEIGITLLGFFIFINLFSCLLGV